MPTVVDLSISPSSAFSFDTEYVIKNSSVNNPVSEDPAITAISGINFISGTLYKYLTIE